MFTTGSKTFFSLSIASVIGAMFWGNFGQRSILTLSLIGLFVVFGWLGCVASHSRDTTVVAMNDNAVRTAAANGGAAGNSLWPIAGALSGMLLVIGLVTDARYFIAGLVIGIAALVQWMIQAWSDRASADASVNKGVHSRLAHAWEIPVAAGAGAGVIVWAFSRIMLAVNANMGLVLFAGLGAVVLVIGALIAWKRDVSRTALAALCSVAALGLIGGGIAGAVNGQNHHLTEENEHVLEYNEQIHEAGNDFHCGEDEVELFDHKSSGGVASTAGAAATFTLEDGALSVRQFEGSGSSSGPVLFDRGATVGIRFKNKDNHGEHGYRLRIDAGSVTNEETSQVIPTVFCTQLIEEGEEQYLIVEFPHSSLATGQRYFASVPGVDGAEIEIEVP